MTESPASESSVFRVVRHVSWRAECERLLVYDVGRDVIYDGNRTALFAVERFDGRATIGEIAGHLAALTVPLVTVRPATVAAAPPAQTCPYLPCGIASPPACSPYTGETA